ncbi:hypothetical protein DPMN_161219 [Dreissena polymorpha]|uniref:Uncharacterized protein n=1 Tax=Dreissena polymorpha TaxID=45954 RepID=A0A9D4EPL3_DREPO|nr:hypothetical protein DPMN_161219 [Dreissena polymorpha]
MTKARRRGEKALPGATQQASSFKPTGDTDTYKRFANQVLRSREGRNQQHHQAIDERQICNT